MSIPPPHVQVQRGLHVVFTMNPASDGFEGRCATSPALFNRCVVDWFGTWPTKALAQVTIINYYWCHGVLTKDACYRYSNTKLRTAVVRVKLAKCANVTRERQPKNLERR